jgi:rhamnogalacturonyl hydrolase YesR
MSDNQIDRHGEVEQNKVQSLHACNVLFSIQPRTYQVPYLKPVH